MKKIFCQGWEWNFLKISLAIAPILSEIAAVGIVVALIGVGRREWRSIASRRSNGAIGALALWLLVVAVFSPRPGESSLGLGNYLPFFLFFAVVRQMVRETSQLRELAWVLAIPSAGVVAMGMGQLYLGWGDIPFTRWDYVPYGDPPGRMSSVFMYANLLGLYLLIVLILSVGLWTITYRSWQERGQVELSPQLFFLTATIVLDSVGLFLTGSRNAWGLGFLAALLFALYLGWRSLVLAGAGLAGTIAIASWGPPPPRDILRAIVPVALWARLSDEMYPDRPLATLRSTQWRFALEMARERPLTGWGLRNFSKMYKASTGVWMGHAHNLYIMLAAETGIVGLSLFCAWVAWVYGRGVRSFSVLAARDLAGGTMLFSYLVAFGGCILFNLSDVTVAEPKVNAIAWLLLASIAGIGDGRERSGEKRC